MFAATRQIKKAHTVSECGSNCGGGRLQVWPYHALGLVALVLESVFIVVWSPEHYSDKRQLVKISGRITSVIVRDEYIG